MGGGHSADKNGGSKKRENDGSELPGQNYRPGLYVENPGFDKANQWIIDSPTQFWSTKIGVTVVHMALLCVSVAGLATLAYSADMSKIALLSIADMGSITHGTCVRPASIAKLKDALNLKINYVSYLHPSDPEKLYGAWLESPTQHELSSPPYETYINNAYTSFALSAHALYAASVCISEAHPRYSDLEKRAVHAAARDARRLLTRELTYDAVDLPSAPTIVLQMLLASHMLASPECKRIRGAWSSCGNLYNGTDTMRVPEAVGEWKKAQDYNWGVIDDIEGRDKSTRITETEFDGAPDSSAQIHPGDDSLSLSAHCALVHAFAPTVKLSDRLYGIADILSPGDWDVSKTVNDAQKVLKGSLCHSDRSESCKVDRVPFDSKSRVGLRFAVQLAASVPLAISLIFCSIWCVMCLIALWTNLLPKRRIEIKSGKSNDRYWENSPLEKVDLQYWMPAGVYVWVLWQQLILLLSSLIAFLILWMSFDEPDGGIDAAVCDWNTEKVQREWFMPPRSWRRLASVRECEIAAWICSAACCFLIAVLFPTSTFRLHREGGHAVVSSDNWFNHEKMSTWTRIKKYVGAHPYGNDGYDCARWLHALNSTVVAFCLLFALLVDTTTKWMRSGEFSYADEASAYAPDFLSSNSQSYFTDRLTALQRLLYCFAVVKAAVQVAVNSRFFWYGAAVIEVRNVRYGCFEDQTQWDILLSVVYIAGALLLPLWVGLAVRSKDLGVADSDSMSTAIMVVGLAVIGIDALAIAGFTWKCTQSCRGRSQVVPATEMTSAAHPFGEQITQLRDGTITLIYPKNPYSRLPDVTSA